MPDTTETAFIRTFFLVLAVLALLTATVLDGFTMRYLMQPLLRHIDARSGGRVGYPRAFRFLLEHAWARRLYHGAIGALAFGVWWYLGTPAGVAMVQSAR